jgi:hypothetical protein
MTLNEKDDAGMEQSSEKPKTVSGYGAAEP